MDLLGDIGHADQLISTRAENTTLKKKVKDLSAQVTQLQLENTILQTEVELYRKDALLSTNRDTYPPTHTPTLPKEEEEDDDDAFVRSGNGIYAADPAITLIQPSFTSNPICCSMTPSDTLLAIGSADAQLSMFAWGAALAPSPHAANHVVEKGRRGGLNLGAPVIATSCSHVGEWVAAGCMDGKVYVVSYGRDGGLTKVTLGEGDTGIQHRKYVKCLEWSPKDSILASASADGVMLLTKVTMEGYPNDDAPPDVRLTTLETFHLGGAIESMCFLDQGDTLCCYVRGTPHLSYFHLQDSSKLVKHSLNGDHTGGFDTHVSFSVMSLSPSPGNHGKYVAAATDASRNLILQSHSSKQIRNLYGHTNDGFSKPKIGWSHNGQYIYGTAQDDNCVCVWDCASSSIVKKLDESMGGHTGQLRDFYSSPTSDTLATISYDKSAKIWLTPMS